MNKAEQLASNLHSVLQYMRKNKALYFLLIPGILYFVIFNYLPMYGIVIAFKDFDLVKGIWGSKWIGLDNFKTLFGIPEFYKVIKNSILISFYRLIWGFPAPIAVAIMMNEIKSRHFVRLSQSVLYLPHFISWVVVSGIVINFLAPSGGLLNEIIRMMGGEPIAFLQKPQHFRSIIVITDIWKEVGWGTVIYLAALSGISYELHEAGKIDGATRLQRIIHITLPGILPQIVVLLVLRVSNILANGFEQIYLLYNPLVYDVADVIETYTYRVGIMEGSYGYATSVGLFMSVVGFILIICCNKLSIKITERGLW